jgi:hypothetical protein
MKAKFLKTIDKKNAVFAISIILLLSMPLSLIMVSGKTYTAMPDRATGTYVTASPQLLGLGQEVLLNIIVYPAPNGPTYYAQSMVNTEDSWENITCTITSPDGTKNTFMPTDGSLEHAGLDEAGKATIVGSLQFFYKPTQIGNYSFSASFPGQTFTTDLQSANLNLSVYYLPSASKESATFTVQKDQVLSGLLNGYPWSQLPSGFWTTPTSVNNREWSAISGDWNQPMYNVGCSNYNPYSTAPTTPHILWVNQIQTGGLVGGDWGSLGYNGIQNAWTKGPIIINGLLIQNDLIGGNYSCWNLYTGQLMWRNPGAIIMGQHISPAYQTAAQANEGGILAWLWDISTTGSWKRIDPYTGATLQTITNVPTSQGVTNVAGLTPGAVNVSPVNVGGIAMEDGNPIVYVTQFGGWNTTLPLKYAYENLIKWNYTKLVPNLSGAASSSNWLTGIEWNVTIRQADGQGIGDGRGTINKIPYDDANVVVVRAHDAEKIMMGFDMTTGARLWTNNNTVLDIGVGLGYGGGGNGPIIMTDGATNNFVAYSVKTGQEIWRASTGDNSWASAPDMTYVFANGNFYYGSYDGHVYAVNAQTGAKVWTSDKSEATDEVVYGTQPFNGASIGANGILYFSTYSTYANNPRPRFMELWAINETTGHFLWSLPIGINPEAIAYGIVVGRGGQDGLEYALGRGPTATTVSAQQQVDGSMLIQGTVMDKSPGRNTQYGGAPTALPNPAVSDASMSEWMDYLYGQNDTLINSPPADITGVPVHLTALKSDGTEIDLGTVTSNGAGLFSYSWKSPAQDSYTIFANFAGSGAYYSSYAAAASTVGIVQPASTQQPAAAAPDYSMTIIGTGIAIAVAVIIAVAIATLLILRKK